VQPYGAVAGVEYEGVAARVHNPGDGLTYPGRVEYRDLAELRNIVAQLPGKPVTLDHPNGLVSASTKVVGRVVTARVDGDRAVVRVRIDDADTLIAIKSGTKELSLGYQVSLDSDNYQRETEVDHLAIVQVARCGDACQLKTDSNPVADCCEPCRYKTAKLDLQGNHMSDTNIKIEDKEAIRSLEAQRADAAKVADAEKLRADSEKQRADQLEGKVIELEKQIAANAVSAETEAITREAARADAAEAKVAKFDSALNERVNARVALITKAAVVLGSDFRMDNLSDREIMAATVQKLDPSADISAQVSDGVIQGRFLAATDRHASSARSIARAAAAATQARTDSKADKKPAWMEPLPTTKLKNR
jgi:hypothetical protein